MIYYYFPSVVGSLLLSSVGQEDRNMVNGVGVADLHNVEIAVDFGEA